MSQRELTGRPGGAAQPEILRCRVCGEPKPSSDFAWRNKPKGTRQLICRPCRSAYHRKYYEANKRRYVERAAQSKRRAGEERAAQLIQFFERHPCADCGERDPVVLEFDHLRDKAFDIGHALVDKRWQEVLAEIEKCEIVCANCHRRRTLRRQHAVRTVLVVEDREG